MDEVAKKQVSYEEQWKDMRRKFLPVRIVTWFYSLCIWIFIFAIAMSFVPATAIYARYVTSFVQSSGGTILGIILLVLLSVTSNAAAKFNCPRCNKTFVQGLAMLTAVKSKDYKCPHCHLKIYATSESSVE